MWALTEGLADSMSVQQPTEFFRVPSVSGLPDETVQSQSTDKQQIHLLATGKQLSAHIKIWVHDSGGVQYSDSDVEGGAMTVIDAETLKGACQGGCVFDHIIPKPRVIFGTGTVPKLDAVTPNNDLPTKVRFRGWQGEVFEGIRVPDPSIVG